MPRPRTTGAWIGYIPSIARYRELYAAALAKGIRLINTPTQHERAMEGDRALPLLRGITPETVVVTSPEQCEGVAQRLGLPFS
jgi:hypothetical protein